MLWLIVESVCKLSVESEAMWDLVDLAGVRLAHDDKEGDQGERIIVNECIINS